MEKSKFSQGVWSFDSFKDYLNEWILPNILGDLDTLFNGAAENWVSKDEPDKGRGDFMLATALFSAFDHLGGFLAQPEKRLHTLDNISRIAKRISSISEVDLIIAHFGRHPLVHSAWPDTMFFVGENKAFGLNIYAYPDIGRCEGCKGMHMLLYKKKYPHPSGDYEGVKLRINVHHLLREFKNQIINGEIFADVKPKAFKRMKKIAFKTFDGSLDERTVKKANTEREKLKDGDSELKPTAFRNELIKQVMTQISTCEHEFVTPSCPIKNDSSDN